MFKSTIIKRFVNSKIERYGYMLKLDINSGDKTIDLEVLLRGESAPLKVHVGRYEVIGGAESGIKIGQITTSREWITEVINALAPEHTVKFNHAGQGLRQ